MSRKGLTLSERIERPASVTCCVDGHKCAPAWLQNGRNWQPYATGVIGSQPRLGNRVVRSSPVAFDEIERAVVDMRERFLSIGEHISGLLSTLTQQIDTAPPGARASINSAAEQISRTQQKLRLQMTNLPTHPEERYQIMRSLLQAQSGALQQLSIIVQQFTPQVDLAPRDRRDGLSSLSMSDDDYDWPPAPRGVVQPLPSERYAPPPRRLARKAKPPGRPANRSPARSERGATMMAIVGSRMLAGVAFLVVVALAGYSYFPDFGNRQGKRRVEPVTTTASIGEEVKKDQTALEETPALSTRDLRARGQPAAEAPTDTAAAVETAALPQRTLTLPGIATTDPGTSLTAATNLVSPFPGMPRTRDPAPVEQGSTTQVLAATKPSAATADGESVPDAPPQFVAVVFTHQDREAALDAFSDLRQRFPNVLARRKAEAQPIEIADKGVWHRLVVLPAGTRQNAVGVCDRLEQAGYDRCWVKAY